MDTLHDWECFDADIGKDLAVEVREYFIPDFTCWKDHDSFERAFARFLKDLQATETPPVPREEPPVSSAQDAEGPLSKQSQQQHLRELIEGKTRRLRHLEKREAVQGSATEPKDRIEIEDLRREISKLEATLRQMGG